MKNKGLFAAFAAFVLAFSLVSCQHEELAPYVADGMPVRSVTLLATSPEEKVSVTKATAAVESNIENLALVLIPRSGGKARVFKGAEELQFQESSKPSDTNIFYTLTISESALVAADIRGGQYYLYAIANYNKKFVEMDIDELEGMTKSQIDELVIAKGTNEIDPAESSILMTGKYCEGSSVDGLVTLYGDNPATNTDGKNTLAGTIHLRRIVSKVQFDVVAGEGISFKPRSYSIRRYSRSTTLMERDGWDGSDPKSLTYAGNDKFSDPSPYVATSNTFVFYMPENVQVAKNSSANYNGRESHTSLTEDQTFANAPDNGTYVVIKGDYSDANYVGEVTYTIHLGDFGRSVDNYTVRRNYYYKYKINVKGVSKIVAECEASALEPEDEPQPGAEGNLVNKHGNLKSLYTLDSHYEQVMLSFPTVTIKDYSLLINTPYSGGDRIDVDGSDDLSDYCDWIHFAAPATDTKLAIYDPDNVCDIYTLIDELKGNANTCHYLNSGDGNTYIVAYIDEYFYENKEIESFVGVDDRILTLYSAGIKYSQDKHSYLIGDALFSIKQKSIQTAMLLSSDNPFGIETLDESIPNPTYNVSAERNAGSTVNGWDNFSSMLTTAGVVYGTTQWSDFVSVIDNGHYSDDTNIIEGAMVSDYDYGFYQCLSRNRDENGNGKIDEDEIKWYLPSYEQYCVLFLGEKTLDSEARLYPPQEGASGQFFTSNRNLQRMYFANEGFASNSYQKVASWIDVTRSHIRCARSLKKQKEATSKVATKTSQNLVVVSGLNDDALRSSYVEEEYGEGAQWDVSNSMTYVFEPASADLSQTFTLSPTRDELVEVVSGNVCANSPELVGEGWRVPSMKEFYLMLQTGVLTSSTKYVFRTTLDDPREAGTNVVRYNGYDGNHIYSFTAMDFPLSNAHIRCVRDISNEICDIAVSDKKLSATKTETSKTFRVFAKEGVEWTITSNNTEFTVEPASGVGNATINVTLPTAAKGGRKCIFTVTPVNIQAEPLEVKLTQETADLDLAVSTNAISVDASSTSASFDIIADPQVEWAVSTTTGVTGFTIGQTSGSGNATINLTYDPVTVGRKIVVTVSSRTDGVVNKYHTITFKQGVVIVEKTYTWTLASGDVTSNSTTVTKDGIVWTVDKTSNFKADFDANKGLNAYYNWWSGNGNSFALSADFPGTVKSISVKSCSYSSSSSYKADMTLMVSGTTFLKTALSTTSTEYTGTGSASGRVMVSYLASGTLDVYIKSIKVVYEVED